MGMLWRITQGNYCPKETITLREKTGTLSADWPFVWRIAQYHCLLEIKDRRYERGCYLFSSTTADGTLRFHSLIHTKYIMVSVGPETKRFWVETRGREVLPLVYTGLRRAGLLVRKKDGAPKTVLKKQVEGEGVTWT